MTVAVRIVKLPCCDDVQSVGCSQNVVVCSACNRWSAVADCEQGAVTEIPVSFDWEGELWIDDGQDAFSGA